jgi:hypothetical protein
MILSLAPLPGCYRMRVVEADQAFAVWSVQRERVVDTVWLLN